MPPANATVARLLRQYAAVLALEGADRFKVKAYRRAAETIDSIDTQVASLVAHGEDLKQLPGIGKAISGAIEEIVGSGKMPQLEKSIARLGPAVAELASVPALDPRTVKRVSKKLKIGSLDELRQRLQSGEIRDVLGARVDYRIRQGLAERPGVLRYNVRELAVRIEIFLKSIDGVVCVSPAGSLRRRKETVGDLNFVVAGNNPAAIFKSFARFAGVQSSEQRGKNESLFKLSSGLGVSLSCTRLSEWGWALISCTGSAGHLTELQAQAARRRVGWAADSLADKGIDLASEEAIYRGLGLSYIEPELREGRGEVAAARRNRLPALVQLADLRGDLHMHTTASDGSNTLAEIAAAARARGYQYIAITDHSQSLKLTNGLTEERLREQLERIDKLNSRLKSLVILKSAEVDILEDGSLDYTNGMLKELDLTICSIHSRFGLDREKQTSRILRAMDNRYFNILGHATGRLLLKREGYEVDIERIVRHAKSSGCFFEINSSPDRLDLSDENARLAKESGVMIAVNTDAHSLSDFDFMAAGVDQARRGWLEPDDVLNTRSLAEMRRLLRR